MQNARGAAPPGQELGRGLRSRTEIIKVMVLSQDESGLFFWSEDHVGPGFGAGR